MPARVVRRPGGGLALRDALCRRSRSLAESEAAPSELARRVGFVSAPSYPRGLRRGGPVVGLLDGMAVCGRSQIDRQIDRQRHR